MGPPTLAGKLLVATQLISDPTFERTVILLLAHGDEGSLGVVINRPSDASAADLVAGWGDLAAPPAVMFVGGPVGTNGVIGLAPDGTIDLNVAPEDSADRPRTIRLFAGSAGWGPGQLEGEIGEQAWWVVDAEPGDAFSAEPEQLWAAVLRRQTTPTAWFAVYPPDPDVN